MWNSSRNTILTYTGINTINTTVPVHIYIPLGILLILLCSFYSMWQVWEFLLWINPMVWTWSFSNCRWQKSLETYILCHKMFLQWKCSIASMVSRKCLLYKEKVILAFHRYSPKKTTSHPLLSCPPNSPLSTPSPVLLKCDFNTLYNYRLNLPQILILSKYKDPCSTVVKMRAKWSCPQVNVSWCGE